VPTVNPIRSEADYQAALARAKAISQAQPGELEFDELEVLTILLAAYEARQLTDVSSDSASIPLQEAWVFHGAGGRFTSGVFASQAQAEEFIFRYRLTGCLTKYPVGISAYDWATQENLFKPKKPEHCEAAFIQRFTTASQEHYHYDPDDLG
jgi:hypothetical protein